MTKKGECRIRVLGMRVEHTAIKALDFKDLIKPIILVTPSYQFLLVVSEKAKRFITEKYFIHTVLIGDLGGIKI